MAALCIATLAKGDIKMSIGLFLKHIESSCEGNDFLMP